MKEYDMPEKVIAIEKLDGPYQNIFLKTMRMVPDRDKNDKKLQRLIAFRLRTDGEAATREYLINKIRDAIQCGYTGSFYNFLKDDLKLKECDLEDETPDPLKA
jgi:hypothetical protein